MDPTSLRVSILIATYGRAPRLAQTLDSLAAAKTDDALRRVWVLENGPPGAARGICAAYRDLLPIEFRTYPAPGKNRAMQQVLSELGDDLLLFLDDDIRVEPDLIQRYTDAADRLGPGHYFGGSVTPEYEEEPPAWLKRRLPHSAVGFVPEEGQWQFLGANFAAFADDVRRAGGFDPRFGPGAVRAGTPTNPVGSEASLQRQLGNVGVVPVPVPEALVWHWVPADRCTAAWALQRARRKGISLMIEKPHTGPRLFGVPRWMVRQLLESLPIVAVAKLMSDPERSFDRQFPFYRLLGLLEGDRLSRTLAAPTRAPSVERHA